MLKSPGDSFREALKKEKPLQIIGTLNAYTAMMAEHAGFRAIYLSGAGVANSSYGFPDIGMTTLDNVLIDANRITDAVNIPLLVDIDTGWGNTFMVGRAIKAMEKSRVAAIHIEDQVFEKRCGHLPGKELVSISQMVDRIKAAVDARTNSDFVIIARTDAFSVEGFENSVERALAYIEAGADMIFPEALCELEQYRTFKKAVSVPILANLTEFGRTPLFTTKELAEASIDMALYPLSLTRAMNLAALKLMQEIRHKGTQRDSVEAMQTREELYGFLHYTAPEALASPKLNS